MSGTRQYLRFYLPLTITGLALVLGRQFQNGTLARFPEASRELAVFAFATGTFFLFNAALGFVAQMANALARSWQAHRTCMRFTLLSALLLSTPLAVLAFTAPGAEILSAAYGIRGETLADVVRYLRYLAPLVVVNALRQYFTGLLVQGRHTGLATVLDLIHLFAIAGILWGGLSLDWKPVETLARAQVGAALLHLVLALLGAAGTFDPPREEAGVPLTLRRTLAFFWPVAVTSLMFALSRPVIYAFVGRLPDSLLTVAALRVAFDFAMIFHMPLNQFRHLFITFGTRDLAGVRRFLLGVTTIVSGLMLLVVATPVSAWIFGGLLGAEGELLRLSRQVIWVLCLVPLAISLRNYYHGLALVSRRTRSMAVGGILRVGAIALASWSFAAIGVLDHVWAAVALLSGFVVEAVTVLVLARRQGAAAGHGPAPAPVEEGGA